MGNTGRVFVAGGKINKIQMLQMIQDGASILEMAKKFNCSDVAIHNMKKRLEQKTHGFLPELVKSELNANNIDAMKQLKDVNDLIIEDFTLCQSLMDKQKEKLEEIALLEAAAKKDPSSVENAVLEEKIKKTYSYIQKWQDQKNAISAEVRKHIELQLRIAETLYNVNMMSEFQEEVINVLKDVDPAVKDEVVRRLKDRRALRGLLKR